MRINIMDFFMYCAPGIRIKEEWVEVSPSVSLRVLVFSPAEKSGNPDIVFVPGWISLPDAWTEVLRVLTKNFVVYYLETREKITSKIRAREEFSVEAIGKDIASVVKHYKLKGYILLGSSLGATAVLDCCRFLSHPPLCLVLIGPNAEFRVPTLGMCLIRISHPRLYFIIKPIVKWYLRTFRLDVATDREQYEKYCRSLDGADPWKLKKAVIAFSRYSVWSALGDISYPVLVIGASKDILHEPENLKGIVKGLKNSTYRDMETNKRTHSPAMVGELREYIVNLRKRDFGDNQERL
jgi:pimeloyl-ACP methyl ester carboxylesterase